MTPSASKKILSANRMIKSLKIPKQKTGRLFIKSVTTSIKIFLFILSVFGAFLFYVWQHSKIDQLAKELDQLTQEARLLENANERLNGNIANLSNYNRIESIAREQLQLKPVKEKPTVLEIPKPGGELDKTDSEWSGQGSISADPNAAVHKKPILPNTNFEKDNGKSPGTIAPPSSGAMKVLPPRSDSSKRVKSKNVYPADLHSPSRLKKKEKN